MSIVDSFLPLLGTPLGLLVSIAAVLAAGYFAGISGSMTLVNNTGMYLFLLWIFRLVPFFVFALTAYAVLHLFSGGEIHVVTKIVTAFGISLVLVLICSQLGHDLADMRWP